MRIHSSISRLTPFWLSHFFPGSEGVFEFLALWIISMLSPGCRTRQDAEVTILPFFTQWHMWPGPTLPPLQHPSGMLRESKCCTQAVHVVGMCGHSCAQARAGAAPPLLPGNSCLTLLVAAQLYTPFPGLTPHPPQQQGRQGPEEDLLGMLLL